MPSAKRPPSSLPLRMVGLHAKLALAILVGIAVTIAVKLLTPGFWGTRALAGWDAGIVVYLSLTLSLMWRANITHIRRRASQQDEGAGAILTLSIIATFASLVAVVFALGGAKQAPQGSTVLSVAFAFATILLSWTFVFIRYFLFTTRMSTTVRAVTERLAGCASPRIARPTIGTFCIFPWSSE